MIFEKKVKKIKIPRNKEILLLGQMKGENLIIGENRYIFIRSLFYKYLFSLTLN